MLPPSDPDRIQIAFDDHRLVANAGLLLPVTLALHLGLPQLVDRHLRLGNALGRANTGDKVMTLVASALAGGDCIDDADVLRSGGTASAIGCVVKAPSTLGTFLRSFWWGHVRQLDRVSRELLARAWAAGAGPGDGPLTIDLDSTICETYGLAKEGARHHGYTGQRGYHPLLAVAAGTGDVLMVRLRASGRCQRAHFRIDPSPIYPYQTQVREVTSRKRRENRPPKYHCPEQQHRKGGTRGTQHTRSKKTTEDGKAYKRARNETPKRKEARRKYQQLKRQKAKALGLCWDCTAPAIHGKGKCEPCTEKHRGYRRKSAIDTIRGLKVIRGCHGVLSAVFKIPKCTSHLGIGLVLQSQIKNRQNWGS